ncbi:glycosyltransferase [Lysobacter yangpyeongensis]|uniref:Glycosyltransferase n=1 Tax=Lysobacter yangpyeongensis TaxID=346182 RepID=A0ABW0SRI1_9GAMM
MRYLLVAYDFPPVPSPQALRWSYLTRELAELGNEVHVLAPDIDGYGPGGELVPMPGVTVHRCDAGLFTGYLVRKRRARRTAVAAVAGAAQGPCSPSVPARAAGPEGLNWKGRLFERANKIASMIYFPDLRGEWVRPARRALDRLLDELQPDVVISSHEPAVSIPLGLHAKRRGFKWICDLGDPVLAPYTPSRWRRHAFRLERRLCQRADLVTTTTEAALQTLSSRHGITPNRMLLLTQGFDHRIRDDRRMPPLEFDTGKLELVYTGSFYAFRDPSQLLAAVAAVPGVRLTVATIMPPPALVDAARQAPESVRLAGFLSHGQSLSLQRHCDMLVNIANDDPIQIPGKLYEYLGSPVRILSIGDAPDSASGRLLSELDAGWLVPNTAADIVALLERQLQEKRSKGSVARREQSAVDGRYSWHALAGSLHRHCALISSGELA